MIVVLGIGNPGPQYEDTRHNVGFMVVDKVAEKIGITFGRSPYEALAAEGRYAGKKVALLKPQTFVNLAGESARIAAKKLGVDSKTELLVVTDDADLEPGIIRFRGGGGAGGHHGLESITEAIGADFARLRIGIGRSDTLLRDHVLSSFTPSEREMLEEVTEKARDAVLDWVSHGLTYCQNTYNKKTDATENERPEERS